MMMKDTDICESKHSTNISKKNKLTVEKSAIERTLIFTIKEILHITKKYILPYKS